MVHCLEDFDDKSWDSNVRPQKQKLPDLPTALKLFAEIGEGPPATKHCNKALQQSTATSTTLHSLTFTQSGKVVKLVLRCALHGCGCLRVSRRQLRWAGEKAGVAPHLRISSFWKTFIASCPAAQLRQMGSQHTTFSNEGPSLIWFHIRPWL